MAYNQLNQAETHIIEDKGTQPPFTGEYDNFYAPGIFICRKCNQPLFSAKAKFDAHCGWPAFEDHFPKAVTQLPDADGIRIEIQCSHCQAHLGHVFTGERFTHTNTRHCVNSLSIRFIPEGKQPPKILHK
jgi:peptide-methionine (R)-S-oxide reductase